MAEKSEGEISDSEEEGATEEVNLPSPKRLKSEPQNDVEGIPSRGEERQETRRRRRKRLKYEKRVMLMKRAWSSTDGSTCDSLITSLAKHCLDPQQVHILTLLAGLVRLPSPSTQTPPLTSHTLTSTVADVPVSGPSLTPEVTNSAPSLQLLKTGKLQGVILHLLLGLPWLPRPIEGLDELYSCPVAILWLSMVSAELWLSSPDVFSGLKSLTPCVQFLLEHPGSDRYAKLGLESFMFMSDSDDGKRRQRETHMKRTDCVLDYDSLIENNFPMPAHPHSDASCASSSYWRLCEEWPASVQEEAVNDYPMCAVDCEMVKTRAGLELARISIVNEALQCIYDKLVKPDNPVLDYKTQFSGITEETLSEVSTNLRDVHGDLFHLLPPQCILIGHSLENDLQAMKMTHPYIIDTSCLFLSSTKCVFKPKLRMLAKKLLGVDIQVGNDGHSSVQDARTCMKLVLKKLREGKLMSLDGNSILTEIASVNHSVAVVDRPSIISLFGPQTSRYPVATDEDAVEEAREAIAQHDLTFLQLHSYEDYLKTSQSCASDHESQRVLRQLDTEVVDIVGSCQRGTLVVVVCGSSDIREVKKLQQKKQRQRLKEVVSVARTGLTMALMVT